MSLRFAGQEGALLFVDATSGDQLIADADVENIRITLLMELTMKQFIGEVSADYREFSNGAEVSFKFEHTDAGQTVDMVNQIVARAQGASSDEFDLSAKYVSPDGGGFRVILRDLKFEDIPLDLPARTDFLNTEMKAKCKVFKVQKV